MVKRIAPAIPNTAISRYLIVRKYIENRGIARTICRPGKCFNSLEIAAIMRVPEGGLRMKMQIGVGLILAASVVTAQTPQNAADTPEAHVAIAQTAAGEDYQNLFNFLCAAPAQRGGGGAGGRGQGGGAAGGGAAAPRGQGGGAGAAAGAQRGGGGQRGTPDR